MRAGVFHRVPQDSSRPSAEPSVLPTLFGAGYGNYPLRKGIFALSFSLHLVAFGLILALGGATVIHHHESAHQVIGLATEISPYILPRAATQLGGGGGGGDRDRLPASKGVLPRFSREQITPPAAVIRNESPKLVAEPTVVGPPELHFSQVGPLGDPLSTILGPASNGPGSGGGIGSGSGGGVGSGHGPGVGPGHGGGIGGGVYRVGGGVTAPRLLYGPDPEFSEEARKAKYQGTVVLTVIVGPDGRTRDIRVYRALGMGLDQKAVDAIQQWKFEPARRNGVAVAVLVNVEVNFRLY